MSVLKSRSSCSNYVSTMIDPCFTLFKSVRSFEDGRIIVKSDFENVDSSKVNSDFYSRDFSLDSLIANGCINQLHEVSFDGTSKIDSLIESVNRLKSSISSNNEQN